MTIINYSTNCFQSFYFNVLHTLELTPFLPSSKSSFLPLKKIIYKYTSTYQPTRILSISINAVAAINSHNNSSPNIRYQNNNLKFQKYNLWFNALSSAGIARLTSRLGYFNILKIMMSNNHLRLTN